MTLAVSTQYSGTSNSSTDSVTATVSASVGEGLLIAITIDSFNTDTAAIDEYYQAIESIDDGTRNQYRPVGAFMEGSTTAAAGPWTAIWLCPYVETALSSATMTVNLCHTMTAKVMDVFRITMAAGNWLAAAAMNGTASASSGDPASMSISSLTSREYLWWRTEGLESGGGVAIGSGGATSGYTRVDGADVGSGTSGMNQDHEYKISTATGETSDPTTTGSPTTGGRSSVFCAIYETTKPSDYVKWQCGPQNFTSTTVYYPPNIIAGDVLLAFINDGTASDPTLTGFTQLITGQHPVYYRVADGTETGSTTLSAAKHSIMWRASDIKLVSGVPEYVSDTVGAGGSNITITLTNGAAAGTPNFCVGYVSSQGASETLLEDVRPFADSGTGWGWHAPGKYNHQGRDMNFAVPDWDGTAVTAEIVDGSSYGGRVLTFAVEYGAASGHFFAQA